MSFNPDLAHKPSPSRKELWKEELGLDGMLSLLSIFQSTFVVHVQKSIGFLSKLLIRSLLQTMTIKLWALWRNFEARVARHRFTEIFKYVLNFLFTN